MTGRKVPWTKSWAIAYFYNNPAFGKQRYYLKRKACREDRRYLKSELKKEIDNL